jgi:hypothetical protein
MRSILVVLGLLIALSTSADAATMHHSRTRHLSPNVASSFNFAPGRGYERTAPSVQYLGSPPAYNDPGSNNGGGLVGSNPFGG